MKFHCAYAVYMAVSHPGCIPLQLARIHCMGLLYRSGPCAVCRGYKNTLAAAASALAVGPEQLGIVWLKKQAAWNRLDLLRDRILMGACCSSRRTMFLSRERTHLSRLGQEMRVHHDNLRRSTGHWADSFSCYNSLLSFFVNPQTFHSRRSEAQMSGAALGGDVHL